DIHWTQPALVAEVEYACWTTDKLIRQSTFQGLREDKPLAEIVYDPEKLPIATAAAADPPPARFAPAAQPAARLRDGSIMFEGVRLSHPDRALYVDTGLTKQAVAQYYVDVAGWALPHLAYRPLTIIRSTSGKGQRAFYQKHVGAGMPKQIKGYTVAGEDEPFPIIEDVSGLIALVQMGVVEIHPWGSTVRDVEHPDRITFDLDPDEGLPWQHVIEAAIDVREALDAIGLRSFVKTTGGKGLHVVVPLRPQLAPELDWDAVKTFAKWVAERMHEERPDQFTANMSKQERRGRIYLDYLRNSRGATAVGAYSPRERAGTPVSTPLSWEEVESGVPPTAFTVATIPARLAALEVDPWAEIGEARQTVAAKVRKHIGI
ncbi:MAG TPA: DNA ligase D, partial [Stellaceae bacterium]|nr:DNA ligase D [Stellaceae bacterium]